MLKMMNAGDAFDEDQEGAIKLFVGQIPKSWGEEDVRQILEPFGPIQELTVLRDKMSGTHKGGFWGRSDVMNA